ncbi:VOC family protein [Cognatishimia sp. F0-27]|uniref:bleomycin resistance protein n=1 Tax=Cognatishimia sp. F0-27 TaxID=2816855 RepID=UPI001D0CA321|nr:VOC family protein [Cognatishimia sp. F0-27]MCC1492597.1 VOC family protein [Cognatishimia sp. F0-27]
MSDAPRLTQITPFVPCSDLARQIGFYRDVLGFTVGFEAEGYAFLRRDAVAVRLVQVDDSVDLGHPERQGAFYIDVVEIDRLYAGMESRLAGLAPGRVRAPFDQPYGQREFHVKDEDATLIFFGEALRDG